MMGQTTQQADKNVPEPHTGRRSKVTVLRLYLVLMGGIFLASLGSCSYLAVQFHRTRADLFERAGQVQRGMTRAHVEGLFEGYAMNESRHWPMGPPSTLPALENSSHPGRATFSNPDRTALQGFEHVTVVFDEHRRVLRHVITVDP